MTDHLRALGDVSWQDRLTKKERGLVADAEGQCRHEHDGSCSAYHRDGVVAFARKVADLRALVEKAREALEAYPLGFESHHPHMETPYDHECATCRFWRKGRDFLALKEADMREGSHDRNN